MNAQGHVQLRGNAGNVCDKQLACSTDKLVFPTMEVGRTSTLSLVCVNVGTQPVTVTGTSFTAQTSGAFSATLGRTPQTVQPGDSVRLSVDYTPQTAGADGGTVTVNSDACKPASVDLEGTGKAANYPLCLPPQTFQPTTQWAWTGSKTLPNSKNVEMSPMVVNLDDDNMDGRFDENDTPEIIFTSCAAGECTILNLMDQSKSDVSGKATLRAIHGKDGSDFWTVTDATLMTPAETQIAVGDLDGDNIPDIVAVKHSVQPGGGSDPFLGHYTDGTLLVFDNTGKLEFETDHWKGDKNTGELGSAPTIGDIDGDGKVEIVFEQTVFHSDGTKWFDMTASGTDGHGSQPSLSDLNGDGIMEVIVGKYAFKSDGTPLWTAKAMYPGPTMVLDVDGDGSPEVILRDQPTEFVVLNGLTGAVKYGPWTWPAPAPKSSDDGGICSAATAAADVDGDGKPDIIIPSGDFLYVINPVTGNELWKAPIDDYGGQCGASGAAAFDFNGNGQYSVVYHDTAHMYVFEGPTGRKLYDAGRNSSTIFETPVIADVDNDGHADLVMTNENGILGVGAKAGIEILSNVGNTWPATRRIWNQHGYHISDVNDNGTIPRVEVPVWKSNNSWRAQKPLCRQ